MTMFKERLEKVGVNTAQARLNVLAIDSLRETKGRPMAATVELFWEKLVTESWVAKDAWLRPYLADRAADMRGGERSQKQPEHPVVRKEEFKAPPKQPTRQEKNIVKNLIKKAVQTIQFKVKTSDGRDWARVGAHELVGMNRDGRLAQAIHAQLGRLSNAQTFMELGKLLSPEDFHKIRKESVHHTRDPS